jgi:putative DNA primase/helicase
MTDIIEAAQGRWPSILGALAGLTDQQLTDRHQPCPLCGGTDRYRFDDKDGSGSWYCNRCGGKTQTGGAGNGMDLLMRSTGWDFKTAAQRVEQHLGLPMKKPSASTPRAQPSIVTPDTLPPETVPMLPPPINGSEGAWCYSPTFWVARFPGKKIRPLTWDGATWQWKAPAGPRPLLLSHPLAERPDAPVLMVEGEKAWDAARRLFPFAIACTWSGGCKAISKTGWAVLTGRKIVLWPDNDAPGLHAMAELAQRLLKFPEVTVRIIANPPEAPEGWDLADASWTPREAAAYVKANITTVEPEPEPEPEPEAEPEPELIAPAKGGHFTCLGFDQEGYYYLPRNTGQVVRLVRSAHTGTNLCSLAGLAYWESLYPGKKEGVNWTWAAASLFEQQASVGVYDPDRVRGRGAWLDDGRVIFHLGDRLIVDGRPVSVLSPPPTRYFYEQARHLDGPGDLPLPDANAMRMRLIAERFRWEIPASAHFLLGWLVLAPVCGALNWRPHIWLTGGAGTGKTTILKAFLRPLLGGVVQSATGGTTEAGLRGTLKSDAIPVVFDEFEQNEQKDKLIVQNVLALARIASSEGGKIYKGTTSGGATSFEIRSMFCVSSINVSLIQKADIDRFCVLGLRKDTMEKNEWLDFEREIATVASIDNGRALINRTLQHLPTIIQNARVLAQALGRRFGQRFGDQHGTLLAGAWSLEAGGGGLLDLAMADQWLDQMEWQHQQPDNAEADEIKCRDTILQQIVRLGAGSEASFGEMVRCVVLQQSLSDTIWDQLVPVLGRYGMRVYRMGQQLPDGERAEGHFLAIANTNAQLDHVLRSTPWSGGAHRAALKRIAGAYLPNRTVHFAGVGSKRCVMVPLSSDELG